MRIIPEDNLAYPVLIKIQSSSSGSGFLLNTGEGIYFVTAKHVLYNDSDKLRGNKAQLICQTKDINDESVTKMSLNLENCKIHKHKKFDIAAIDIGKRKLINNTTEYELIAADGVKTTQSGNSPGISVKATYATKLIDEVLISNDVFLYGYPTSLGLKHLPQFDYDKPLLRKGIVANIYKQKQTIILDCPAYYGNSGGPVVEVEFDGKDYNHKVIGVVSSFIPYIEKWHNPNTGIINTEHFNSGYSVAICMDVVFELIDYKK